MPAATDEQVQNWSDQRTRVRAEQIRALFIAITADIAQIADVYTACTQQSPTWEDARVDGPPHLLSPSDLLAINTLVNDIKTAIDNSGQYAVCQAACVRAPGD
jgi:hypothetical protein